jgi:hypothetical protein
MIILVLMIRAQVLTRHPLLQNSKEKKLSKSKKSAIKAVNTRNPDGIFNEVFGEIGDKAPPPFTFTEGYPDIYSEPKPAGKGPERTGINYLYNQLYALGVDLNKFGSGMPWDATITYSAGSAVSYFVAGEQNYLYISLQQTTGDQPDLSPASWDKVPDSTEIAGYIAALASNAGAGLVGTTSGNTVQQELDGMNESEIVVSLRLTTGNVVDTTALKNVASVTKPGIDYIITFQTPIVSANCVPQVSEDRVQSQATTGFSGFTDTQIQVSFYDIGINSWVPSPFSLLIFKIL